MRFDLENHTKVPAVFVRGDFPKLVENKKLILGDSLLDLAKLANSEFQKEPDGSIRPKKEGEVGSKTDLIQVPFRNLKNFMEKNPIREWNYPGFLLTTILAKELGYEKAGEILEDQYLESNKKPLNPISSLELLGVNS